MSAAGDGRAVPAVGPVQQGLKEALIETLTAILSPVQEVRAAAEEQIKVLEVTEGEKWPDYKLHQCLTFKCFSFFHYAGCWFIHGFSELS